VSSAVDFATTYISTIVAIIM